MRGYQDRHPLASGQPSDLGPEVGARLGVEAGRRLVKKEHSRAVHQPDRDVQLAGHAAGIGLGQPLGHVVKAEHGQQLGCPGAGRRAGHVLDPAGQHQVLPPGGHRIA